MSPRLTDPAALAGRRAALVASREPQRRVIAVCAGTGCRAQGALGVVDALRAEVDTRGVADEIEIRATGCLGFCQASPLVMLQPEGIVYRARRRRRRRRDRREDRARRRRRPPPLHRRGRHLQPRGGDPLLPRPAAPAAARQRPPRPDLHRRLHRARRLRGAGPGAGDGAGGGPRRRSSAPACAAAAAPASPRAASGRPAAEPRASSSTWSATPTRATPGPSWTTPCSRATRTACSRAC